jgi:transposase
MDASTSNQPNASPACPRCAELERVIVGLQKQIDELKARLEKAEAASRAAKRQAAPFSKGPPKADPKPPGRKSGEAHGPHFHRGVPPRIDETYDVPLPKCCSNPNCPGRVREIQIIQQYQADMPREPVYRQFDIHQGECDLCHKPVQGRHPLQTSDATGAAASQIGPLAQAVIVHLNKEAGMSYGKIVRFFSAAYGLELSRAAACRIVLRAAGRCEPAYEQILIDVQQSEAITPDETGWRVAGLLAWLHVAVGDDATAYLIHRKRGYEAAVELIGADYEGFLIHDGWSPYERFIYAVHQTCLAHLLRRSKEMEESAKGKSALFPQQVKDILKDALAVRDRRDAGEITPAESVEQAKILSRRILDLVIPPQANADNERLAKHLWKLQESLFTFLEFDGVDATNYKGEQAIRPAAVNRKVWGGNRTEAGAEAQSILMSVLRTAVQRGIDGISFIIRTLTSLPGNRPLLVSESG